MKTVIRVTVVAGLVMAALSGVSHAAINWSEVDAAAQQMNIGTGDNEAAGYNRLAKEYDKRENGDDVDAFNEHLEAANLHLSFDANTRAHFAIPAAVAAPHVTETESQPVPDMIKTTVKPITIPQPERNTAADSHHYVATAARAYNKALTAAKYADVIANTPAPVAAPVHQTATAKPTVFAQTLTASTPAAVTASTASKVSIPATTLTPATKAAVVAPAQPQTVYQEADPETVQAVNDLIDAHNENVTAIDSNTAAIDNHEQRLGAIESHDKQQDKTIAHNNKRAMAGIAGALAQTGLHYTDSDNSVAVGAGNYSGESAIAVGFSYQLSNKMRFSVQNSVDTAHKVGSSASIAYGW